MDGKGRGMTRMAGVRVIDKGGMWDFKYIVGMRYVSWSS